MPKDAEIAKSPLERHIQSLILGVITLLSLWTIKTTNDVNTKLAVQTDRIETLRSDFGEFKEDVKENTRDRYTRTEALRNNQGIIETSEAQDEAIQDLTRRLRDLENKVFQHQATHQ